MKKRLPDAVRQLTPVEKLIWLYVDRYPGLHSGTTLSDALGVYAGRALPALVDLGLLVQEEPPTRSAPGRYRAVTTPAPAQKRAEGQNA